MGVGPAHEHHAVHGHADPPPSRPRPCRLTWGAIQRRRAAAGTAVLLTTHSMEEADLLADTIAIMAHGRCGRQQLV